MWMNSAVVWAAMRSLTDVHTEVHLNMTRPLSLGKKWTNYTVSRESLNWTQWSPSQQQRYSWFKCSCVLDLFIEQGLKFLASEITFFLRNKLNWWGKKRTHHCIIVISFDDRVYCKQRKSMTPTLTNNSPFCFYMVKFGMTRLSLNVSSCHSDTPPCPHTHRHTPRSSISIMRRITIRLISGWD